MKIYQLVYLSFASNNFDPKSDQGIDQILNRANSFNKVHDITGMLLYRSGVFLQLLEGDEDSINSLVGKIAADPRHEGLKVLVKQNTNERIFYDWSMAYKNIDDIDIEIINDIIPWNILVDSSKSDLNLPNNKILDILKTFRFEISAA